MKLSELFFGNKQISDTGKVQAQSVREYGSFGRQLQSLAPGQTIQGEVISRNGNEVKIKVSDDVVLKAKVDQSIHLELGKTITFEVKNNGQTLTLSPLYTNTAADANVLKALDMASLPVTSDTIYMTQQMMQAGLSIDRNSLQQMYKEVSMFSGNSISDIVDLHRMTLPVNEENLAQISSYKNMTHQLVNGFDEVISGLSDTVNQMVQNGEFDSAAKLYQEIIHLISEAEGRLGKEESGLLQETLGQQGAANSIMTDEGARGTVVIQDGNLPAELFGKTGSVNGETANAQVATDLQQLMDMLTIRNHTAETDAAQQVMGSAENNGSAGKNGTIPNAGLQSDITALLGKLLQQGIDTKDNALLQNLLGNKDIAAYLKENLKDTWTISPQDVAEGERVSELYQRLGKQLRGLAQTLETLNQTGSEAYRSTASLTQNIDFLQQINQTYTYMQLPLRLQQGNDAHGDLYVYTNKKHLASKDGQITALLHLDMENLGPLDVYVAMQGDMVSTKFYVQDEILDFLEAHMHILTDRIRKRGYQCNCEMLTREEESSAGENVIHRLLEKEPQIPLVQYAFDVRT